MESSPFWHKTENKQLSNWRPVEMSVIDGTTEPAAPGTPGGLRSCSRVGGRTLSTLFRKNARDKAKAMVLQTEATRKPLRFGGTGQVSEMS